MTNSSSENPRVAIVGAGIGGLTLALALQRANIACHVYERSDTLSEVGAGITLWGNAIRALASIGVADAVAKVAHAAGGGALGLANGEVLSRTGVSDFGPRGDLPTLWTLHRAELQRALFDSLPEGTVSFGRAFGNYQENADGVTVSFEGGATVAAEVLVGADGLHSRVRRQMLGDVPPRYSGYACFRAVCPKPRGWSGVSGEFWGKGDRFGVVEIPGERLYWFAVVNAKEADAAPDDFKAAVSQRFAGYAHSVPEVIAETSPEAILFHKLYDRDPFGRFHEGRVCLLGDAAHPTTPNLGQGAAMAIESAIVLARCLNGSGDFEQSFSAYERVRAPRTRGVTTTSRSLGQVAQLENGFLRSLRNLLLRLTPKSVQLKQLRTLVDYDAANVALPSKSAFHHESAR